MEKCATLTVVFFNNSTLQTRIYIPVVVDFRQRNRPLQLLLTRTTRKRSGYEILTTSYGSIMELEADPRLQSSSSSSSSSVEEPVVEDDEEMEYIPMKPCLATGRSRSLPFIKQPLQRLETLKNSQGSGQATPTLKVLESFLFDFIPFFIVLIFGEKSKIQNSKR